MRDPEGGPASVRRDILKKKNMIVITSGKRRVRPALPIPLVLLLLLAIPAGGDTLRVVGRLALPYCTNVSVRNRICYVTDSYGLEAVDVSNPANPLLFGRCQLPDTAQAVTLRDSIAYVSDADSGLAIINVAMPESLRLLARWRQYEGYAHEGAVWGDTAYLAYGISYEGRFPPYRGGLMLLNISDPRAPVFGRHMALAFTDTFQPFAYRHVNYTSVGYSPTGGWYVAASVLFGDFIGSFSSGFIDPGSYRTGGIVYDWQSPQKLRKMHLNYPFAYITYPRNSAGRASNLAIVHFTAPGRADTIFEYDLGGNGRGIWADTGYVYASFDSTVRYINVSDPSSPVVLAACTLDNIANGLQAVEPYVYVANGPYLTILQHSPSGVEGRGQEAKGLNCPEVRITPNPFKGHCTIRFGQGQEVKVVLSIYNAMGRKVRSFVVSSRTMREIPWDGKDEKRNDLSGGVYFLRYDYGTGCETRKVILIR